MWKTTDINDIQHPAIREAMKMLDMREIRLTYEADLPARSGLGTSSSFAVGMLNAFYALKGKYADKKKLADEAIYLERVLCNESGGWQDQIAASFGGFNRINFNSDGYEVLPVIISPERKKMLNDNLLMFFTGFTRFSSDVQKANKASSSEDKSVRLKKMYSLVDEAEAVLTDKNRNLDEFGHLLDTTWKLKKGTGGAVSTGSIDELNKLYTNLSITLAIRGIGTRYPNMPSNVKMIRQFCPGSFKSKIAHNIAIITKGTLALSHNERILF